MLNIYKKNKSKYIGLIILHTHESQGWVRRMIKYHLFARELMDGEQEEVQGCWR